MDEKKAITFYLRTSTIEKLKEHVHKFYGSRSFFVEKIINETIKKDELKK